MGYPIPQVDEYIRFMRDMDLTDPKQNKRFHELYQYVMGMLDMAERIGDRTDAQYTYNCLSYVLANKLNMQAFMALRYKVETIDGALKSYPNDFYKIDLDTLYKYPDKSFIWALRDVGTHLYFTDTAEHEDEAMDHMASVVKTFGHVLYMGYWDAETQTLHDLPVDSWKQEYEAITPGFDRE